jgi:hypothetical protein
MTLSDAIEKYFARKRFYHFTDERNIQSIRASGGLFSRRELQERKIEATAPGGNEWSRTADDLAGLDKYVHLCFMSEHPMEYRAREEGRIQKSRFLRINPGVLAADDVRVTNKRGTSLLTLDEAFPLLDREVMYERTDWKNVDVQQRLQAAKKYELLIPKIVPLRLISGL